MKKTAIIAAVAAALAGCAGGGPWFKEALVLYRGPAKGSEKPVFFGLVTEGHSAWFDSDGNIRPELPGAKPIDLESAMECLDAFRDSGWPDDWEKAGSMSTALSLDPKGHILICEIDGELRVLPRPAALAQDSQDKLQAFAACKTALIECGGYGTGYRVVRNAEGGGIFERQQEELRKEGQK